MPKKLSSSQRKFKECRKKNKNLIDNGNFKAFGKGMSKCLTKGKKQSKACQKKIRSMVRKGIPLKRAIKRGC